MCIVHLASYLAPRILPLVRYLIEKGFHAQAYPWLNFGLRPLAGLLAVHLLREEPLPLDLDRLRVLRGWEAEPGNPADYHLASLQHNNPTWTEDQCLAKACMGFFQDTGNPWPQKFNSAGNTVVRGLVAYYLEYEEQQLRYNKVPLCRDLCDSKQEVDIDGECHNLNPDANDCHCRSVIQIDPEPKRFFGEKMRVDAKVRMCPDCRKLVPNPTGLPGAPCRFCDSPTVGRPHTYWYPSRAIPLDGLAINVQNAQVDLRQAMDMLVRFDPDYEADGASLLEFFANGGQNPNRLRYRRLARFVTAAKQLTLVIEELKHLTSSPGVHAANAKDLLDRKKLDPQQLADLNDELDGKLREFHAVFGQ